MPDDPLTAIARSRARRIQQQLDAVPHLRVKDAQRLFEGPRGHIGEWSHINPEVAVERIRELEFQKVELELALERANARIERMAQSPKWLLPVGVGFGLLTVIFLMAIVFLSIAGRDPSPNGKFALVAVIAFGSAFASATWIGKAVMTGEIKSLEDQNPVTVSATGGFAMFLLVFFLGYWFYIR
jgi:hypothetical protein